MAVINEKVYSTVNSPTTSIEMRFIAKIKQNLLLYRLLLRRRRRLRLRRLRRSASFYKEDNDYCKFSGRKSPVLHSLPKVYITLHCLLFAARHHCTICSSKVIGNVRGYQLFHSYRCYHCWPLDFVGSTRFQLLCSIKLPLPISLISEQLKHLTTNAPS